MIDVLNFHATIIYRDYSINCKLSQLDHGAMKYIHNVTKLPIHFADGIF